MKTPNSLTVGELIEKLSLYPKETQIMVKHKSHDYWKTELALPISRLHNDYITYSEYHDEFKIVDDYDRDEDKAETLVLIIK